MATIKGIPDESGGRMFGYAGPNWLASCSEQLESIQLTAERNYTLDLSNINLMTLSAWAGMMALIERSMSDPLTRYFEIDLKGETNVSLLEPDEYLNQRALIRDGTPVLTSEYSQASRIYAVAGFLESLGSIETLGQPRRVAQATYRWLGEKRARLRSFHTSIDGRQSVVMRLMRIDSKENCKQFLDQQQIMAWREAMGERFRSSVLFESEELWRIFCHELAVNIYEHAETAGFLAARVVEPAVYDRPWCKTTYAPEIQTLFPQMRSGFVELCVSDAGAGFVRTLEKAYRKQARLSEIAEVDPAAVLAFAFDEFGTCKTAHTSWATERHALGRILQIVGKYGGALAVQSGTARVLYRTEGGAFDRIPGHLGYRPQVTQGAAFVRGSHLQLILPLSPLLLQGRFDRRRSILVAALPDGYVSDRTHVRGHLIPLYEALDSQDACVGSVELLKFRAKCELLAQQIMHTRAPLEPLVLDFSNLRWTPAQFETLLHLLQNVLQHRPVLLVEIDPALAREVVELEGLSAPTQLDPTLADEGRSISGRAFGELSEERFLETYQRVHSTVLGLDINGRKYIFGLAHREYEPLFLSLIDTPQTLASLFRKHEELNESVISGILNNINPLFSVDGTNRWRTVWDASALANEARRVMSRHFEDVAERAQAWRGRGGVPMTFNLPWQEEWVCEFFESSHILSRQRAADEAAQRLIFRLQKGLQIAGKSLDDVKTLACVTAPAILLAAALHRWWPTTERPAIADLGPYLLLNPERTLPAIAGTGGIVVVQDVLDRGKISRRLVQLLRAQDQDVLCVLSLARLVEDPATLGVTAIDDGWRTGSDTFAGVTTHSMVNLLRPARCPPSQHDDPRAHWIEPRTLRPFRYSTLRREFRPKETKRVRLRPFFAPKQKDIICAGHYVYGERHYSVALDIKRALDGEIGDEISLWLADLCHGTRIINVDWETKRGRELTGDVSAVLLPLHSQIHYLWPRIENLLAQRGRRQLMWLLDATLFLGHGPAYRLPRQFQLQIRRAVEASMTSRRSAATVGKPRLRILILDDAMVNARTAETILAEIDRAVSKASEDLAVELGVLAPSGNAIEWVRYFAVFNHMSHAKHQHWRNLETVGSESRSAFVFEEYRSVTGVPMFEETDCPSCTDLRRLERVVTAAERHRAEAARLWASDRAAQLRPVAIDSPNFRRERLDRLPRSIDLLARNRSEISDDQYVVSDVDEGILRFYELMYMSYPPSDVLRALSVNNSWAEKCDNVTVSYEYERFRWAIFEWCLRKWPRLIADSARKTFFEFAELELQAGTPLVERLLDGLARHRSDNFTKAFAGGAIEFLWSSENERARESGVARTAAGRRRMIIENALTLFLLNVPEEEIEHLEIAVAAGSVPIVTHLAQRAAQLPGGSFTFLSSLYLSITRPRRFADPAWALQTVAETLYRGRDPDDQVGGSHRLLPRLLSDVDGCVADSEDRRLLQRCLSLFLAALDDLAPFVVEEAVPIASIRAGGDKVLKWLNLPESDEATVDPPSHVTRMIDALALEGPFSTNFNKFFHQSVEDFQYHLHDAANRARAKGAKLDFEFAPAPDVRRFRALVPVQRLYSLLTNWGIDRAGDKLGNFKTRIEVHRHRMSVGTDRLRFRILTNFDVFEATEDQTLHGGNYDVETRMLRTFGAELPDHWERPSASETGFTAAYEFSIPVGFTPKSEI